MFRYVEYCDFKSAINYVEHLAVKVNYIMDKHFNVDYLFENQFEYIIYLKEERKLVRQFKFILPNIEPINLIMQYS